MTDDFKNCGEFFIVEIFSFFNRRENFKEITFCYGLFEVGLSRKIKKKLRENRNQVDVESFSVFVEAHLLWVNLSLEDLQAT
jgi:hypothetical protein